MSDNNWFIPETYEDFKKLATNDNLSVSTTRVQWDILPAWVREYSSSGAEIPLRRSIVLYNCNGDGHDFIPGCINMLSRIWKSKTQVNIFFESQHF